MPSRTARMMYGMPPLPARVGCHSPVTLQELLPPSPPRWMQGRFGQGGCPQRAVLGGGAPRAPLGPELSTRLSPCLEESSAQRAAGFAPQHQGLGPGVPSSSPSRPRALCGCPAPAVPCSTLQVLWPYLLEFVTPIQFTNALTPLCKSLMYLAMKKQEEGENANLIRYDLNGGSQPHPLCPCTLGARLHAGEVPGCCRHSVGGAF